MRERIGAVALVAVVAACAACSGGPGTSSGAAGTPAASAVPVVCVNVASLRATVQQLTSIKPDVSGVDTVRLAANNVFAQIATFVSAAPPDMRQDAQAVQTAVEAVRSASSQAGSGTAAVATAITGVDAAWKDFEAKLATACPS